MAISKDKLNQLLRMNIGIDASLTVADLAEELIEARAPGSNASAAANRQKSRSASPSETRFAITGTRFAITGTSQ